MARKTREQLAEEQHAAKPLHIFETGGGKPAICGDKPPFSTRRGIHPAFVTDTHLSDPMICAGCVTALPAADHSLPVALFGGN